MTEDTLNATLTIRVLVHGKDAGRDIGKERKSVRFLRRMVHISTSQKETVLR